MAKYNIIGKPIPRLEGIDKVQGGAKYVADLTAPGMLWGGVLRSPYPHARILRVETSRARSVPGVHSVITAQDIPNTLVGRTLRDMPLLARDRVRFIGEKVVAVAAESPEVIEEALSAIDVEYEELPTVFNPLEAMENGAPLLHENLYSYEGLARPGVKLNTFVPGTPEPLAEKSNVFSHVYWSKGDIQEGFEHAYHIFEHTFTCPLVHQAYLEPHACVVQIDPDGKVEVWANNKAPFLLRTYVAQGILLPEDQVVVHGVPIGGDFGGKGSFMDVPVAYFLARDTGRPMKMVMSYVEELMAGTPRHPAVVELRSGVTRTGTLTACHARVVLNSGAYGAFKPGVNLPSVKNAAGVYRTPHVRIDSIAVYTNCVPCGYFRGPGEAQVVFAIESHMDMIAHALALDPVEFRMRNLIKEGDTSSTGEQWHDIRATETLQAAVKASRWGKPKRNRIVGRGISICEKHALGGPSGATLTLEEDGSFILFTPILDTGTGIHLILRQLVGEVLTVNMDRVRVATQDTSVAPYDVGASGSRVTHVAGQAALQATQKLVQQLATLAAQGLGCGKDKIRLDHGSFRNGRKRLTYLQLAQGAPNDAISASVKISVEQPDVPGFCAQVAEVKVDPETGQVEVRQISSAHDVSTILNPLTHQGQIEGALIQGFGYALLEEMKIIDGRISTLTLGEYKIPSMRDLPPLITVLVKNPAGQGPFQSKTIAESSLSGVAPAIANAIFDAVGVRITDLPISAERVYHALDRGKRFE